MKIIRWVLSLFFTSTILVVIAYRFIPVYITPLMIIRCVENGTFTIHHRWIPLESMSPHMPVAVMAMVSILMLSERLHVITLVGKRNMVQAQFHSKQLKMFSFGLADRGLERVLRYILQP